MRTLTIIPWPWHACTYVSHFQMIFSSSHTIIISIFLLLLRILPPSCYPLSFPPPWRLFLFSSLPWEVYRLRSVAFRRVEVWRRTGGILIDRQSLFLGLFQRPCYVSFVLAGSRNGTARESTTLLPLSIHVPIAPRVGMIIR